MFFEKITQIQECLLGEGETRINKLSLFFGFFSFRLFETLLPMILLVKSEERHDRSDHSQVMLSCKTSEFKKSQRFLL